MTKSKLSIFFDTLTISLLISFLTYIWINRYLKNAILSYFICNITLILLFFVIFKFLLKKYNLNKMRNLDTKNANIYLNHLIYSTEINNKKFFEKLLDSKQIYKNIFENNSDYFYIEIKNKLTENDFHRANDFYLSSNTNKQLSFICNNYTDDFKNLISSSPIKYNLFYFYDLFAIMKLKNIFPYKIQLNNDRFKKLKKFKTKVLSSLTKNHFKNFLLSGLSLVVASLFIPFSYYYLLSGSFLLVLSIICLFNKNKKLKNNTSLETIIIKKTDTN